MSQNPFAYPMPSDEEDPHTSVDVPMTWEDDEEESACIQAQQEEPAQ